MCVSMKFITNKNDTATETMACACRYNSIRCWPVFSHIDLNRSQAAVSFIGISVSSITQQEERKQQKDELDEMKSDAVGMWELI